MIVDIYWDFNACTKDKDLLGYDKEVRVNGDTIHNPHKTVIDLTVWIKSFELYISLIR